MGRLLDSLIGKNEEKSVEEQFEVIVDDLQDHPDKLFVWQFPDLNEKQLEELYNDVLDPVVSFGMKSEHVFTTSSVEIDELVAEDGNIIRARDKVFEELSEEEQ